MKQKSGLIPKPNHDGNQSRGDTRLVRGFTLIEMLVVVAIIGILSSAIVVGLGGGRKRARDARRIQDIRQIQNKLELEYRSPVGYPTEQDFAALNIPPDPQGKDYIYERIDKNSYRLGICLETDEVASSDETRCPGGGLGCASGFFYCVRVE